MRDLSGHIRILMGTFQGAVYLQDQLDSFVAQSHADWSLWVSDDGSSDATRALLTRFARTHPDREIRVFNGPGRGAAANYLSLLAHPALPRDGACLALSDQDDVWMPDRLEAALGRLRTCPATGPVLYAANTVLTDARLQPIRQIRTRGSQTGFHNALVQNVVAGNTIVLNPVAATLARAARPATPVPFHDWWLYLLITGAGGKVAYDKAQRLFYRQHGCNTLGAHRGPGPALHRMARVMDGTYRAWVGANLTALRQLEDHLTPENRARVASLAGTFDQRGRRRLRSLRQAGVQRDSPLGQRALSVMALTGRI
jgi:glycosyltransferase involved in cell wall biosynthesis